MNAIDKQPVPLGGSRVPESMGGSSSTPWQELPEQKPPQVDGFGEACDSVLSMREQIGALKKQLSNLAVPMKEYIYSTEKADRAAIESALSQVDSAAAAIATAAASATSATAADDRLSADLKSEASKLLTAISTEVSQQAAECRTLCMTTADKSDTDADQRKQGNQQPMERPEFSKELYGDFNLQLGPSTRKMFASQSKLLALVKSIKKQTGQ